jgi:UrcA family protein
MKFRSTILTALTLLGLGAGFATVHADESNVIPTKTVSYADLNLDNDVGAKEFYARIRAAAKLVCSGYSDRDLATTALREGCVDKAVASAVSQAHNAKLSALYTHATPVSVRVAAAR